MTEFQLAIHSGGQTGVDRAALDAALALGVPVGGWCPRGRRAEDGPIATRYVLRETPSTYYVERTRWNVRDADATLVLTRGTPTGGTATTIKAAHALDKPCYIVDLAETDDVNPIADWLQAEDIRVLNVAGPRGSTCPDLYAEARAFMERLIRAVGASGPRPSPLKGRT